MTDTTEPENISTMTKERAGEILDQMKKSYDAGERAISAGLPEPNRPTDSEGNPIAAPIGQIFLTPAEAEKRNVAETRDYLEAHNFPVRGTAAGDDLWNMIEGRSPVSAELQAEAERKLASFQHSADWRRRLLEGDARAVREFHLATGIIAAGKIQRQQS
jgi:hypothetical protein